MNAVLNAASVRSSNAVFAPCPPRPYHRISIKSFMLHNPPIGAFVQRKDDGAYMLQKHISSAFAEWLFMSRKPSTPD